MMIKLEWESLWVYDGQWLESYFDSSHPNNIYIFLQHWGETGYVDLQRDVAATM